MSAPTRELENLSLGGMRQNRNPARGAPNTRAIAQQRRRARERQGIAPGQPLPPNALNPIAAAQAGPSQAAPQQRTQGVSTPTTAVPVSGHSGIVYDIQQLSPNSRPRAMEGLHSDQFTVDHTMGKQNDHEFYYAFQLKKPESVRIYDPERDDRGVTCTCPDFQGNRNVCVHIYWLYDSLNAVLADVPRSPVQLVTRENVLQGIKDLYSEIGDRRNPRTSRLDSLTKALNKVRGEDVATESEDSENDSESDSQVDVQDAAEVAIQDMLSVFDPNLLPEEYAAQDFVEELPTDSTTLQDLVIPDNLEATIYALARHDRKLRRRLRSALTKDFCAQHVLDKLKGRMQLTFQRLDDHIAEGPKSKPTIINGCADTLRHLVDQMHQYILHRAPLSEPVRQSATETAMRLLFQICNRNTDVYSTITWSKTAPDPVAERDRNLFANLIGGAQSSFIVDFLEQSSPGDWKHLVHVLDQIIAKLRENQASQSYVARLERLVSTYDQGQDDPTRMVGERPPISGERERQRRRIW